MPTPFDPNSQAFVPIKVEPSQFQDLPVPIPPPHYTDPRTYMKPEELAPIKVDPKQFQDVEQPHETTALEAGLSGATLGALAGRPAGGLGMGAGAIIGGLTGVMGHEYEKSHPGPPENIAESATKAVTGLTQFPAAIAEDVTGIPKRGLGATLNRATNTELMDPARAAAARVLGGTEDYTKDPFGTALAIAAPFGIVGGLEAKARLGGESYAKGATPNALLRNMTRPEAVPPAAITWEDPHMATGLEPNQTYTGPDALEIEWNQRQAERTAQGREVRSGAENLGPPVALEPQPAPVPTGGPEFKPSSTLPIGEMPKPETIGESSGQETISRVPPLLTDNPVQLALREVYPDQGTARMEADRLEPTVGGRNMHPVYVPGVGWQLRLGEEPSVLGPEYAAHLDEMRGPEATKFDSDPQAIEWAKIGAEQNRQAAEINEGTPSNLYEKSKQVSQAPVEDLSQKILGYNKAGEAVTQAMVDKASVDMMKGLPVDKEKITAVSDKPLTPKLGEQIQKMKDVTNKVLGLEDKLSMISQHPEIGDQISAALDTPDLFAPLPARTVETFRSEMSARLFEKRNPTMEAFKDGGVWKARPVGSTKLFSGIDPTMLTEAAKTLKEGLEKISGLNFGELVDKVSSRWMRPVGEIADPTSAMYRNSLNRISKFESDNVGNAYTFQQVRLALRDRFPDLSEDSMRRVRDAREGLPVSLEPHEAELLKAWQETADPLAAQARAVGVLKNALADFYTHIILKAPTESELSQIKKGKDTELNRAWFTRPRSEEAYTGAELEAKGYQLLNDPREVIPLYKYYMTKEIYKAELVQDLFKIKTDEGWPAVIDSKNIPETLSDRYVSPSPEIDRLIRDYRRKAAENQGPKAVVNMQIGEGSFKIHSDTYKNIEAVLRSLHTNDAFIKVNSILGDLRRINLLNPLVHGYNTLSSFLQIAGPDILKTNWSMDEATRAQLTERFIAGGGKPTNIFDTQRMLNMGEYSPDFDTFSLDKVWRQIKTDPSLLKTPLDVMKGVRQLSDYILWDRIVAPLQIHSFETLADRMSTKHPELPQEVVDKAAATIINDFYGTMSRSTATWGQQKIANMALLAPRWTPSMVRELVGGLELAQKGDLKILPKMFRIEGIAPELRKTVGVEYAKGVGYGIAGMVLFANLLQAGFAAYNGQKFQPTWENEEGHKLDARTFDQTPGEGTHYLKTPLFRQVEDMLKLVQGDWITLAVNKAHPLWRESGQQLFNVDAFKKEAISTNDSNKGVVENTVNSLGAKLKHGALGLTPLRQFAGQPDQYRDWAERLTPFMGMWMTHGMPAGGDPFAGQILKNYIDFKESNKQLAKEAKVDIGNALKGQDQETANALLAEYLRTGRLTKGQAVGVVEKNAMPFLFRVMSPDGKRFDPEFMKFLVAQTPERQAEIAKMFGRMQGAPAKP